ncbi:putative gibberellin regulated protein [Lupinus albus]|uniref:Putative gibberellin regulated protein n=1 Tax=Lupinus albus TaxID=3870 RepID=A0A6A4NRU4_LUPAL|nr:putative gibberellin regulated protein [Lupinus albus]
MAIANKFLALLIFVLLIISLLQTLVMASQGHGSHHYDNKQIWTWKSQELSMPFTLVYQTQYHKPCMFFCQKCCRKCLCVPPGYYGNKAVCPCYNNWKTQQGGPKCP